MAVLTVQTVNRSGLSLTDQAVAAASGGDSFPNTGAEMAYFKNAGGGSITLTMVLQRTVDGQSPTNRTVTLAAGKEYLVGPFPVSDYNDASARCNFTYSGVTSLTVCVFAPTNS